MLPSTGSEKNLPKLITKYNLSPTHQTVKVEKIRSQKTQQNIHTYAYICIHGHTHITHNTTHTYTHMKTYTFKPIPHTPPILHIMLESIYVTHTHTHTHTNTHTNTCTNTHTYMHVPIHTHQHMHTCRDTHVRIHIYVHINTRIHTCTP